MSNRLSQNKRQRLSIFKTITNREPEPETPSRLLEIVGVDNPDAMIEHLLSLGELQLVDSSNKKIGILLIAYYDLRNASRAKSTLENMCEVKFVTSNSEIINLDYLVVPHPTYIDRIYTLQSCGEIMNTQIIGAYVLVRYFDTRSVRKAYAELAMPSEAEPEKFYENEFHDNPVCYKSEFEESVSSGSTQPSPYLYFSSEESPFEERRKKKKQMDEDEKMYYMINCESIYRSEDLRTTVMIKNIPNKYTQQMLLDTINRHFAFSYDFFYLPIDFKVKSI